MQDNKIDVFDLDGTIFRGNTFHRFVTFLGLRALLTLNFSLFYRVTRDIGARKFKLINHFEWKCRVMNEAFALSEAELNYFSRMIVKESENRLNVLLNKCQNTRRKVLATAAPSVYAEKVGRLMGFDIVISSKPIDGTIVEVIREKKCNLVLSYAASEDMSINNFFTDHHDDVFLAQFADHNYLVDPSIISLGRFRDFGINFDIINLNS